MAIDCTDTANMSGPACRSKGGGGGGGGGDGGGGGGGRPPSSWENKMARLGREQEEAQFNEKLAQSQLNQSARPDPDNPGQGKGILPANPNYPKDDGYAKGGPVRDPRATRRNYAKGGPVF